MKRGIFVLLFMLLLAVVQTSFLAHFQLPWIINIVVLYIVLLVVFERSLAVNVFAAFWGGLLIDVLSGAPFGLWAFGLPCVLLLFVFITSRYVQSPFFRKT